RPYLLEGNVCEPQVRELYDRRKETVEARHLLVRVGPDAAAEDTLDAWNRLSAVRDSVLAGADFGKLAATFSEDPSAKGPAGSPGHQGLLGYFGGGRMVEAFEDQAYNTAVGEVSDIFRTQFGYHILQVTDRKPMPEERTLAHIMVRLTGDSPAEQAAALSKLDSIATRLQRGDTFADVAEEYSDDQNSASQGGSIGRMSFDAGLPFSFRDAAFAIAAPGEWVGPVQTMYGFHFIQYVEAHPLGTYEEEYEGMKGRITQMPRTEAAQQAFVRSIREDLHAWVDTMKVEKWHAEMRLDSLVRWLAQTDFQADGMDETFIEFADTSLTVSGFSNFFRSTVIPVKPDVRDRVFTVANRWLDEQAIEWRISRLEESDLEFATTMQDFRDGLLLFRFMEQEVWNRASADSSALLAHYSANKDAYQFPDRVRVFSLSAPFEEGIMSLVANVREQGFGAALDLANADSTFMLRVDTTFVSEPTGSMFDQALTLNDGQILDATGYNRGWITLYRDGVDPARGMSFDEARSEVINEVQVQLEANLMIGLRERYAVQVFPERLQQLDQ
ncbi:MAG: peptidylprolyl isomerase, partial [Bacteroidota bacterium]|nr:peptidylprolyl isomerase [Bacteroidota bacterium]